MKTEHNIRAELEVLAREMGVKTFGVANISKLLEKHPDLLKNLPGPYLRAIVMGIRLQKAVLENITNEPVPIYVHNYRQVNYRLDRTALLIADKIQDAGFLSLAVPASQYITKNPFTGHISHKRLALAAGIGFIGKNNLLVHPEYGSQVRYVSILTDMPLEADKPHTGDCGSCKACIETCPAGAIKENRDDFDLNACTEKLNDFGHISFVGQNICGVCIKACSGKPKE